ncbi:ribonuclease T2 family protein [Histidinibacterium aquaticum]|uniref:Ribonuclease T2 n=1 Tax=Histidinibacterium aquaticum TaxID=2613962 RepID=A0A5J5GBU1_9RHOB|nr:ribonuclease T2 [Histidinibacterium aquaticum]KAA9005272.1 ribonuclease T2 [Histidinibacterium aquaticum]
MLRRLLTILSLLVPAPLAAQDRAGEFDYYVLALSWSANWCALEGDARDSPQCDESRDYGWALHGLWPQYDRGWPDYCETAETPPTRRAAEAMLDITGTPGLVQYQWEKHGTCSGLSAEDYLARSRAAFQTVTRPPIFRRLQRPVRLPASVVEEAFLEENPDLSPDGITVTCREGHIQEVRICLTRELEFRVCGSDVRRDCALTDALMTPPR